MASNYTEYYLQLVDSRTKLPIDDDAGLYEVFTADSPAEATIYSDDVGTAGSNPGTISNGIIRFFTASTVTSVDITVLTSDGVGKFAQGITPSQHRLDVDPEADNYEIVLPFTFSGASEAVVDTGFDLLAMMAVKDVLLHVTTAGLASGGFIMDVGTSTDPDGFIDGQLLDTTGFKVLGDTDVSNAGVGDLLTATATNGGSQGRVMHVRANSTSGATIMYTNASSAATTGAGYIYMRYCRLRTAGN